MQYPRDTRIHSTVWGPAGDLDEAISRYEEALEINPEFGNEWKISYIDAMKEDYQAALTWLDRGIAKKNSSRFRLDLYWMRAFIYHWLGESQKARKDLGSAMEEAQKADYIGLKTRALWIKPWLLYDLGDVDTGERSRDDYQEWVHEHHDLYPASKIVSFDDCFYRGLCALKMGQIEKAAGLLAEMNSLLPEVPKLINRSSYGHIAG